MEESKIGSRENASPTVRIVHCGDLSEEPTKMLHKKASIWMLLLEGTTGDERKSCFLTWLNNWPLIFLSLFSPAHSLELEAREWEEGSKKNKRQTMLLCPFPITGPLNSNFNSDWVDVSFHLNCKLDVSSYSIQWISLLHRAYLTVDAELLKVFSQGDVYSSCHWRR